MSAVPPPTPLTAPLARSQTTCAEYTHDETPLSHRSMSAPAEFAPTPTCPPPGTPPPTNCSSQFFVAPYPEPPALRRTDTASNYAAVSPLSSKMTDPEYERWLLEDNFARLSAIEAKLQKQMLELGAIRESLYQLGRRAAPLPLPLPPPSSPPTRQVASPSPAPAPAQPLDMAREFGM